MNSKRPSIPKGMRDMHPPMLAQKRYMLDVIEKHFRRYGFAPLETPAMERLSTLMGKYGDEGDQLLFKVLNSGDFVSKADPQLLAGTPQEAARAVADKGLRYDLTIPLARYVAQHRHALAMPFKRSQIQPVWRADKPQRGRYREFYQCDVDVVGMDSQLAEAELFSLVHDIMQELGLGDFHLLVNHRLFFEALSDTLGVPQKADLLCYWLDKSDKMNHSDLLAKLEGAGFPPETLKQLDWIFQTPRDVNTMRDILGKKIGHHPKGKQMLQELDQILHYFTGMRGESHKLVLAPTLARGMNYYTGAIFEMILPQSGFGSVGGGGRYDDLTALFGVSGLSGVGVSFGLERIYDLMVERQLFPPALQQCTKVILIPMDLEAEKIALSHVRKLRDAGIPTELLPAGGKLSKSLRYAEKRHIPWVALLGEDEIKEDRLTLKDMTKGHQEKVKLPHLIDKVIKVDH